MVRKHFIIFMILVMGLIIFSGCNSQKIQKNKSSNKTYRIGISQIVEHQALDQARKGILDKLREENLDVDIEFQNAQSDMLTLQNIADGFVASKKDLIVAIATPSAQTAMNATKDIPIVFTAVTDPLESGLVDSLDKPSKNVTGTSDKTPIKEQLELIKTLFPKTKRIGILYNTSEANSIIQIKEVKKIAKSLDIKIVTAGITNVSEVDQSLNLLMSKIDLLYTPTDNTVASSMTLISNRAIEKKIPVFAAEEAHVKNGALITKGINYYNLGKQTGEVIIKILKGQKIKDTPIQTLKETNLVINKDTMKKLNIKIPENIKKEAKFVGGAK